MCDALLAVRVNVCIYAFLIKIVGALPTTIKRGSVFSRLRPILVLLLILMSAPSTAINHNFILVSQSIHHRLYGFPLYVLYSFLYRAATDNSFLRLLFVHDFFSASEAKKQQEIGYEKGQ